MQYAALVACVFPGMTYAQIVDDLPLAVGLQARNIAVTEHGAKIIPPGFSAADRAREILGEDEFARWTE
jgi:hypothetical protein